MIRFLTILLVASTLTSCGRLMESDPEQVPLPVILPEIPDKLKTCPELRSISSRVGDASDISVHEMRSLWGEDRFVAATCKRRFEALNHYYDGVRLDLMFPEPE